MKLLSVTNRAFRRGRLGRYRMVVEFTTTYGISADQHQSCVFKSRSWQGVLDPTLRDEICNWTRQ